MLSVFCCKNVKNTFITTSFSGHLYIYCIFTNKWKNIKCNISTISWIISLIKSTNDYFVIEE